MSSEPPARRCTRRRPSGRYPVLASLSEGAFGTGFDHVEFGLQRILDGLEVLVAARRAAGGSAAPEQAS